MKMKLLLLIVLIISAATFSGCSMCGSGPGTNSNVPPPTPVPSATPITTPTLSPPASPTPMPTLPPDQVTGIPECDDLFAKFEVWASEKNKNGSKAEKTAVAILKISLIGPLKNKVNKMKQGDRDKLAGQCSLASVQFETKQRSLEIDPNAPSANASVK